MNCPHQILLGWTNQGGWNVLGTWHVKTNSCQVLMGKPEGKRPLGRPRRRWQNNVKIHREESRLNTSGST